MNPDNPLLPPVHPGASDESTAATLLRAWQQGEEPLLDEFIAGRANVSPRELAELVRVDLDARWERGGCPRAEDYLQRFAEIAADAELAVDVIYAEFLARELAGDRPELS